jgi:hypothetical protein
VRTDHAAEVVGIEVFNAVASQPITMALVRSAYPCKVAVTW